MGSPCTVLARRFITCTLRMAVGSAGAKIPNMCQPWNRNISWMRNQEMTSALVITTPKAMPTTRYTQSPMVRGRTSASDPEQQGQQHVRAGNTAGEERGQCDERGRLQIRDSRNAVARCAAAGVRGAQADQEATAQQDQHTPQRHQAREREEVVRHESG